MEQRKSAKLGDINYCKKGKFDRTYREEYCDKNYFEDYISNSDCKSDSDFCYMCCENEFGNMHIDRRDICYNMCDEKTKEIPKPEIKKKVDEIIPFMWK